jgi:hypothetical protein
MEFIDRRYLRISDLFSKRDGSQSRFSDYDMIYKQDTNQLCRFPELIRLFDDNIWIERNVYYDILTFKRPARYDQVPIPWKKVAQVLYDAFSMCKYVAIVKVNDQWEVTSNQKYINESFPVFRNRCLFELRDELGISHTGKGADSLMLHSKYTGGNFNLVPQV